MRTVLMDSHKRSAQLVPIPSGVKVWIATGITDMRRGMNGLSIDKAGILNRKQ
jgi:hypothetical protein